MPCQGVQSVWIFEAAFRGRREAKRVCRCHPEKWHFDPNRVADLRLKSKCTVSFFQILPAWHNTICSAIYSPFWVENVKFHGERDNQIYVRRPEKEEIQFWWHRESGYGIQFVFQFFDREWRNISKIKLTCIELTFKSNGCCCVFDPVLRTMYNMRFVCLPC